MFGKLVVCCLALVASSLAASIDVSTCDQMQVKGCILNPEGCGGAQTPCKQIITWRVSPTNSARVRYEMWTTALYSGKQVDYIAFGLSAASNTAMSNSSIIACAYNPKKQTVSAYLSHNAKLTSTALTGADSTNGVYMLESSRTGSEVYCHVEQNIQPSSSQAGLIFPLNRPWTAIYSFGPTDTTTGQLRRHYDSAYPFDYPVTVTNFGY